MDNLLTDVVPEDAKWLTPEMEQVAMQKAQDRANMERWNRDVSVFTFAILIIVVILLYNDVAVEIVALVAVFGLFAVWLMGWLQGKKLYLQIYREELSNLVQEAKRSEGEEAIEEKIREAMREMWR